MAEIWKKTKILASSTFTKAMDVDIMTQAAAIAFYTIFSITPLLILIVGVSGLFVTEDVMSGLIQEQLENLVDADTARNLISYVEQQTDTSTSLWTTIVATIVMIFGATTVINQLKQALNLIWNVSELNIGSIWGLLLDRLISFAMILVISILLIASLAAEGLVSLTSAYLGDIIPELPFNLDLFRYLTEILTLAISVLFFTLIFKILPDVNAPWKDIITGALVTTILFLVGKYLIGFYFSTTGMQASYRAAGTLVVFVIWVYYNILTILLGAVFTQVYTEKYGGEIEPYKFVSLESKIEK